MFCRRNGTATRSPKPKRALSAYNLFFRSERERILDEETQKIVGFAALARTVAANWKNIDGDERKYFEDIAKEEKERYKREMQQWKKDYKKFESCHAGLCKCDELPRPTVTVSSKDTHNVQRLAHQNATLSSSLIVEDTKSNTDITPKFAQSSGGISQTNIVVENNIIASHP